MPRSATDIRPETGMFLPITAENTQFAAAFVRKRKPDLGRGADRAKNRGFVTMPFPHRAKTRRLNCYPSPDGRLCTDLCGPSIFSMRDNALGGGCHARRVADHGRIRGVFFDARDALPHVFRQSIPETTQGKDTCDSVLSQSSRGWGCLALRPAAKAFPSRRFWARGPGQAQRRCLTVASARARLWARRAMSPIARPIRGAAAELSRVAPHTRKQSNFYKAIGASCAGGFFDMASKRGGTGRRDDRCSRKS